MTILSNLVFSNHIQHRKQNLVVRTSTVDRSTGIPSSIDQFYLLCFLTSDFHTKQASKQVAETILIPCCSTTIVTMTKTKNINQRLNLQCKKAINIVKKSEKPKKNLSYSKQCIPLIEIIKLSYFSIHKMAIAELLEKTKENPFSHFGPKPRPYPQVLKQYG